MTRNPVVLDDVSVLLSVEMTAFGNDRRLRDSAYEIVGAVDQSAAKRNTSAYKKRLDSPILDDIFRYDGVTRDWLYGHCLPSGLRRGVFRVSNAMIKTVTDYLVEREAGRAELVRAFEDDYPEALERTKAAYAVEYGDGIFNPHDYPKTPKAAGAEFTMTWAFVASGVPATLATIDATLYEQERAKFEQQMHEIADTYRLMMRQTVAEMVAHLVDRLSPDATGKRKRIHASVFGRWQEFLATFSAQNIVQDADLASVVDTMGQLLSGVDVDAVREDDDLRKALREAAMSVNEVVDSLVVEEQQYQRAITL